MSEPRAERPAMAAYGVVAETWAPLPWSWAAERLRRTTSFWLVTASAAARPHAMPVWGVWDERDARFFFSCAPTSRKACNLAENPQCTFTVDDTVECVSVEGTAAVVQDDDAKRRWAGRYLRKYLPISPELTEQFVLDHGCYEVVPDRAFAVIEREDEFSTRATRWVF